MVEITNTTINVVKKSLHLYYEEKDINYLRSHCLNNDIPIIGINEPQWSNKLSIINEHYRFYRQSEKSFLVYGKLTIRELSNKEEHCDRIQNVTVSGIFIDNEILFSGIHLSNASQESISLNVTASELQQFYRESFEKCYDVFVEHDNINDSFYYNGAGFNKLFECDTHFVNIDQMFWFMCTECIHPEDVEKMDVFRNIDTEKRIRKNDNKICFDVRIKNAKKKYKWIEITILLFPDQVYRLSKVFFLIKDVDDNKRREQENLLHARRDSLTGIFNRRYTEQLINHAISENNGVSALAVIDVDDFKNINDTFGHLTGDAVLKEIVAKINSKIDKFDIFGRTGGDEFVLLIRNRASKEIVKQQFEEILKETRFEYEEDGSVADIHISIGIAMFNTDSVTYDELYKKGDEALYDIKKNQKNNFKILE